MEFEVKKDLPVNSAPLSAVVKRKEKEKKKLISKLTSKCNAVEINLKINFSPN